MAERTFDSVLEALQAHPASRPVHLDRPVDVVPGQIRRLDAHPVDPEAQSRLVMVLATPEMGSVSLVCLVHPNSDPSTPRDFVLPAAAVHARHGLTALPDSQASVFTSQLMQTPLTGHVSRDIAALVLRAPQLTQQERALQAADHGLTLGTTEPQHGEFLWKWREHEIAAMARLAGPCAFGETSLPVVDAVLPIAAIDDSLFMSWHALVTLDTAHRRGLQAPRELWIGEFGRRLAEGSGAGKWQPLLDVTLQQAVTSRRQASAGSLEAVPAPAGVREQEIPGRRVRGGFDPLMDQIWAQASEFSEIPIMTSAELWDQNTRHVIFRFADREVRLTVDDPSRPLEPIDSAAEAPR